MGIVVKEQAGVQLTAPYVGKNMVNFLNGITLTETRIGTLKMMEVFGEQKSMIVSGHMIDDMDNPSWLYTDSSTVFDKSSKFTPIDEDTPISSAVKAYCDVVETDYKEYMQKLKKINDNMLLAVPFKPGRIFEVACANSAGGVSHKVLILDKVRWETSKETYKLEAKLVFKGKRTHDMSSVTIPIVEYLSTFRLEGTKDKLSDGTESKDIIEFDVCGIVKPIEFADKDKSLIIDGMYLYEKLSDRVNIIGCWSPTTSDLITFKKIGASKIAKKLIASVDLISAHKKYIAPYKTFKVHTVQV